MSKQTKDNAVVEAESPGGNIVFVFANLPTGQKFKLPDGSDVEISGVPVSRLKRPEGGFFPGGKYGVTTVDAATWALVEKIYGASRMFKNKLIFAAASLEKGKDMVRELSGLRHGFEPVDPESSRAKTKPKNDKD